MLTKKELGRRLRAARFERNLTLKQVAEGAGMSATHISEVERGRTSPTIGALERIAGALGEKASYFVEERDLPSVTLTRASDRPTFYMTDADGNPVRLELLGRPLPGGVLRMLRRVTPPGDEGRCPAMLGEVVLLCLSGMARYSTEGDSVVLREGDVVQMSLADGFTKETLGDEPHEALGIIAALGNIAL